VANDPRLAAFVRAVVAAPGDETLRLVLADYLEEQGNLVAYKLRDPGYWVAGVHLTWYRTSGADYPSGASLVLPADKGVLPKCDSCGGAATWSPKHGDGWHCAGARWHKVFTPAS
jgi:uncharacterized protein (TIGR02996 family)